MKKKITTYLIMTFFASIHCICIAQQHFDNGKKSKAPQVVYNSLSDQTSDYNNNSSQDSLIKAKLVALAINNPMMRKADDNIKIAQITLVKAKNSWLGSVNAAGNINELVINNTIINNQSPSTYYPKYNFGVMLPFDIFSKTKNDKKIAIQNIDIAKAEKDDKIRVIKKEVLTLYENYREKEELLRLEKIAVEGDNQAYIAAQKSYSDGTIQLDEMNRAYQTYIITQTKLVAAQHDYNVSVIELEEEIGIPLEDAISQALNPGQ